MGEKTVKYEYEYGLCKRMHYRGLWCVLRGRTRTF